MALAFSQQIGPIVAPEVIAIIRATLDNSYPAGGYPLTPANFGLNEFAARRDRLDRIRPMVVSGSGGAGFALIFDIDPTTGNLRAYYPTGGATASPGAVADPIASGAPPAGATAVTSTAAQPTIASAVTPGRGKEVAAATDLSAFSVMLLAVGH